MKPISSVAKGIRPSATLAIDAIANEMKANSLDVIAFGTGEPDFNTPDNIKAAAIAAIHDNKTRYTSASGIIQLRKGICRLLKNEFGLDFGPENICVTSGAKHSIYIALCALINPGDEVILPAPYWVTYEEAIRMTGGIPVVINTTEETRFKVSADVIEKHITNKTKAVIITSPSNPTGMVYAREELKAIADVIVKNDLYAISDEIYYFLTYKGEFTSLASLGEEIKRHTITINGVSKTYAMTGWRIGYSACEASIAEVMGNYLSHSTGNPSTISQYASLEAVLGDQSSAVRMKQAFDERRRYFTERVSKIDGVSCLEPDGAFYIFMNIKKQLGRTLYGMKIETSEDFASCLLKNSLVAVVPGTAFGADGYLRWSYATSMEKIKEGLNRFEKFLREE